MLEPSTWHNSVCPHDCPSACALEVERLADGRIGRVRGSKHQPYTDGIICAKVSKYAERIYDAERLTQPLIRTNAKNAAPKFAPIEWDAALDLIADKFTQATKTFGAESVWPYFYGGTMGLAQRDGITRLANVMRYSGMKKTFCTQIAYDGWRAGAGAMLGADPREMGESGLVVFWGCNAAATQINAMHHASRARKLGAKIAVVDAYRNPTAKIADLHLAVRPGGDGALACAVMQQLFARGYADLEYLEKFTDDADALQAHLQTRGPAWAEKICGVPAAQIEQFAEWFGECKNPYIRLGIGFSRQRNGAVNVHAVSCLPAITGAWRHKGGGALLATSDSFAMHDDIFSASGARDDSVRVLDMSLIGRILCGDARALHHGAPVKAMLIQNTNPALVAPELHAVRRGMSREDLFVCVHEQFMTETAMHADLVLPATMFMEHDDIYTSYGQTFLQYGGKVTDAPEQCKSNHEVICALAKRLGAEHAGFNLSANQVIDRALADSKYPKKHEFTRAHFHDCAPSFERAHFLNGFNWPDKKFRFKPDWHAVGEYADGMPALPDHWEVNDKTCADKPLRLVAAPARGYLNSTFNRSPSSIKREKFPQVKLHPKTAKQYQIKNAMRVQIGNDLGQITLTAKIETGVNPETLVVESIWPAKAFPENIGINALISADPAAPNGGAAFHDTAVWLRAVGAAG